MGRAVPILLVLILIASTFPSKGSRLLRQTNSLLIDERNVDDLASLVRAASPGTNFVLNLATFTLNEALHFTAANTVFGGLSLEDRPILRCNTSLSTEIGILVEASGVEFTNLVIEGCPGPALRVRKSEANGPPYEFTMINVAFFNNVQISNSYGPFTDGGAMHISSGTRVTINSCEFARNLGVAGGAIALFGSSSLSVFDTIFTDNNATLAGGAIFGRALAEQTNVKPRFLVRNCAFNGNADLGGSSNPSGLRLPNGAPLESFMVLRFPIPQSSAGGIYASNFDRVTITNSSFQNNSAVTAGGAISIADNRRVVIKQNTLIGNAAKGTTYGSGGIELAQGGALYVAFSDERSQVEISNCNFLRNSASYGGGIHLIGTLTTQASISDCQFYENTALLGGGGLLVRNIVQATLRNVQFVQNTATLGGGLLVTNGAGLLLSQGVDASRNCLFLENEALDGAGCCFLAAGTVLGQAVSFNLNRATRNGGAVAAIEAAFGGSIGFQDSSFSNNSARLGGAIYQDSAATFRLTKTTRGNSFLSGNIALAGGGIYLQPWSQVKNEIRISETVITNNEAVMNSEELPSMIRPLPVVDFSSLRNPRFFVDNQIQSFACLPGGGGGICISLIPLLPRAELTIQIGTTNIVRNKAINGGGVLISSSAPTNCIESCPVTEDNISVTSSLCSGIQFTEVFFTENTATDEGPAILFTETGVVRWRCPSA
eukprot:g5782.t1